MGKRIEILYCTQCRISEALALTPRSFDFSGRAIVFETLKKRRTGAYRGVPMPQDILDTIDMVHGLQEGGKRKRKGRAEIPLWPWSRTTAFRRVKEVMDAAGIADGPHKCPKGLRHGYGVHSIGLRCAAEHALQMDGPCFLGGDGDIRQLSVLAVRAPALPVSSDV